MHKMLKKTSQKGKAHKKGNRKILVFSLPFFFLFCITFGWYAWYQSRSIPDLDEQNQMTILPPDIRNVLGAEYPPNASTAISLRIPIFLYHYVEFVHNDPGRQNLTIPPNILTAQIETLKTAGYTFITPNDVVGALAGKEKISTKSAILSFDDGYMDLYTDVFPILQKEQVRAVAYIVPNFLDRPNYLFTFQLKELAKSPLIEIGAHTMNHYALAGMYTKTATYEIAQSRKVLQNLLNLPVTSFAYPYGSFNQATIQLVKDAGFTNAVSVIPGIVQTPENEYYFYRLRPGYRTGQGLLTYLKQNVFQPW